MNAKLILWSLFLLLSLSACQPDEVPPPDVSDVPASLEVLRFDRALMALDTNDLAGGIAALGDRFGEFANVYFTHIIPLRRGDFSPAEQLEIMKAFLTFPLITEIDSASTAQFPPAEIEAQREAILQALRYYRYYLPTAPQPDTLVFYLAQFELAAFLYGDGNLGVGLDFFLGPDYNYQRIDAREAIFSRYLARTYTPAHLPEKVMRVVIEDYFPQPRGGSLIDYLIYEGKKLYLLDKVLPATPDSILHEVTAAQMEWLRENEVSIYAHLQKENLLYATEADLIRKLTQPAPTTPGMPTDSPGQAVNYLGRRIVEDFVRANPDVTMEELLAEEDGQKILAAARYKPR
ncbi:hypothetical protein QWY85_01540 [Neolewinella lacunae]|uniref:Gliding motility lipoprotein GldB n=1 Tax=Neolewinella lacunae TaxID=1517758 RepID=A0A923T8B4_9BACT|nr:hypothetical protein [Neolewinella lacunae]MBC6994389.1 hypothetical protein [Neolewinella lacunae]MDN3633320.1 hypothetical protein [Neolewinella lacunae]